MGRRVASGPCRLSPLISKRPISLVEDIQWGEGFGVLCRASICGLQSGSKVCARGWLFLGLLFSSLFTWRSQRPRPCCGKQRDYIVEGFVRGFPQPGSPEAAVCSRPEPLGVPAEKTENPDRWCGSMAGLLGHLQLGQPGSLHSPGCLGRQVSGGG